MNQCMYFWQAYGLAVEDQFGNTNTSGKSHKYSKHDGDAKA